jgi:hypothetical protein
LRFDVIIHHDITVCQTGCRFREETIIMKASSVVLFCAVLLIGAGLGSAVLAADPGLSIPATSSASDQKAGSLLYYNIYTSSVATPALQNTRFSITNTNDSAGIYVHLFFVDGVACSIADRYICLSRSQTAVALASEQDPGTTGYVVAIATDAEGRPAVFNYLIGDEYVKFDSGHFASLGADAYAKLTPDNVLSTDGSLGAIFFDGLILAGSYNQAPRVLALDNIPDRASGNDTMLIVNRIGGNLGIGAATLSALFGLLYDDAEQPHSFIIVGGCQFRRSLTNDVPKTTPRFELVIPAGQSGWMKIFSQSDIGICGVAINRNTAQAANAFNEGHNLHALRLSAAANLVIPIFPPGC